jgi:cell wall-associated NlpC family hydrolase
MMEDYFSIPYKKGGRDRSGCDCWGFTRLVIQKETGKEIPLYTDADSHDFSVVETPFKKLSTPVQWCIVLMHGDGSGLHTGVFVDGSVLHMTKRGVCCIPLHRIDRFVESYWQPL